MSVQDWMREIARKDPRYAPEAYRFLVESLGHAMRLAGKEDAEGPERHVSGGELLQGMRFYALELFGPLAAQVWRSWGVHSTLDWGHMVFRMVDEQKLARNESDTIEDFRDGFDFDEAFVEGYAPELPDANRWGTEES